MQAPRSGKRHDISKTKLDPRLGLWLILGYLSAQVAGSLLVGLIWGIAVGIAAAQKGLDVQAALKPGVGLLAMASLGSAVLSAGWGVGFPLSRLSAATIVGGEDGAVAWRPSKPMGYVVALLACLMLTIFAWLLGRLMPPDLSQLTGPMEELGRSAGWPRVVFLSLAIVIMPPLEEFVFRGVLFASLAGRFGNMNAVLASTILFVLFHVADKIHYWPGFVAVGMLGVAATALRLRYRSLWPGILMHALYNAALVLS